MSTQVCDRNQGRLPCNGKCKPTPRALSFLERWTNRASPVPPTASASPVPENLNDAILNTTRALEVAHDRTLRVKLGFHLDALLAAQIKEFTQ